MALPTVPERGWRLHRSCGHSAGSGRNLMRSSPSRSAAPSTVQRRSAEGRATTRRNGPAVTTISSPRRIRSSSSRRAPGRGMCQTRTPSSAVGVPPLERSREWGAPVTGQSTAAGAGPAPGRASAPGASVPRGSRPRWATASTVYVSRHSASVLRCWATGPASQLSSTSSGSTRLATRRSARSPRRARPRAAVRTASAPAGEGSATRRTVVDGSARTASTAASWRSQRVGGQRHPGEAAEHGPQGAGRLPFGREQAAQVAAEFTGEGEQGEGALGGREVDDEEVVLLRQGRVPQGAQQGELLGAGQRGQFVGLQAGGAEQVECGAGAVLQGGEVLPEVRVGLDAAGGEPRGCLDGCGPDGHPQHRAQGVRPVGAEDEGAGARAGGGQRGAGRDGGTAAAAGARDQEGTHEGERYPCATGANGACAPRRLERAGYSSPDSTRFFSPASARSMMTFSALRLIMPSIGILTSTVSR